MHRHIALTAVVSLVFVVLAGCAQSSSPVLPGSSSTVRVAATSSDEGYLYVENVDSTISAFAVAASGALTELAASPYDSQTTGPATYSLAIDPKGPYLYATGSESDNVAIFAIGSGGALTPSSSSTNVGTGASFLLFPKGDDHLYVLNGINGGSIAAFDVTGSGRKLKSVKGSPFGVGCPGFCTSNPTTAVARGSYLYTVDTYGWYVSTFSMAKNGVLTELNSYATGYGPSDSVLTPNGKYLYVTDGAAASISGYGVSGGVLAALKTSPFSAGAQPAGITITPNGKHLYVADQGDSTISGYSIGSGGVLKALAGSPFADGSSASPTAIETDKSGKHLFVADQGGSAIAVYSIKTSGALAPVAGSPFSERASGGPIGLALYQP